MRGCSSNCWCLPWRQRGLTQRHHHFGAVDTKAQGFSDRDFSGHGLPIHHQGAQQQLHGQQVLSACSAFLSWMMVPGMSFFSKRVSASS